MSDIVDYWDGVAESLPIETCEAIFLQAAGGREMKFWRWLADKDGNDMQWECCIDCIGPVRRWRRRQGEKLTERGWNDFFAEDVTGHCFGCHALLTHTLTEYGIERELGFEITSDPSFYGEAFGDDALILLNMASQLRNYERPEFHQRYSQIAYATLWEMAHGRLHTWGKKRKLP